ncbi:MAG TPA: ATP-grasp domain-containing protein [Longimicrobiales bacterium]|nr:ATP-grasp domain-containing protein [Longimicrobiales bacterium]
MKVLLLHGPDAAGPPADPVLDDVEGALAAAGHAVTRHTLGDDLAPFLHLVREQPPELVFNLTEDYAGKSALDSSVASLMNLLGLRYTGASHAGLLLAGDKALAKKILSFHEVLTPQFATLHRGALESAGELHFPLIVKPPQQDASIGITSASVVRSPGELLARLDEIHREYRSPVLVEQFVEGREYYVGVLGNEQARALPVVELDMSGYPEGVPRVASWAAKWEAEHAEYGGSVTRFPEDLAPELEARMQETALAAFHALRLRDYARIDLRVSEDEAIHVIEVNPNCYLARSEVFSLAAERAGIPYEELIARIADLASARYSR